MSFAARLRPSPDSHVTIPRLVELLKLAASKHYRLCSAVGKNEEGVSAQLLGETAADVPVNYRVVEAADLGVWRDVFQEELNTNFDMKAGLPLWRTTIIAPPELVNAHVHGNEEHVEGVVENTEDKKEDGKEAKDDGDVEEEEEEVEVEEAGITTTPTGRKHHIFARNQWTQRSIDKWKIAVNMSVGYPLFRSVNQDDEAGGSSSSDAPVLRSAHDDEGPSWYMMFTFHHCLGDGLSMYAFARTFLSFCDAEHFNAVDLGLDKVPVVRTPPPVLDNLFNPNILEVTPIAMRMMWRFFEKKRHQRFKGRKAGRVSDETLVHTNELTSPQEQQDETQKPSPDGAL
ncbi:hypothetical protein HK102_012075, partial [Quaeritorhiza haematococci]